MVRLVAVKNLLMKSDTRHNDFITNIFDGKLSGKKSRGRLIVLLSMKSARDREEWLKR